MKITQTWTVITMLAVTAVVLFARGDADVIPSSDPLSQLPRTVGAWEGSDIPIDSNTRRVLGKGSFLSRAYSRAQNENAVTLFIGYFPQQRAGVTVHSPKHCLPGNGWDFESSRYVNLRDVNGNTFRVGEYTIVNGEIRQFVIYWYLSHGRSIPNEYMARFAMAVDAIRLKRTDGALIRVMTMMEPGEDTSLAQARAESFTVNLVPTLHRFIPD
jgi:EpsI family protein